MAQRIETGISDSREEPIIPPPSEKEVIYIATGRRLASSFGEGKLVGEFEYYLAEQDMELYNRLRDMANLAEGEFRELGRLYAQHLTNKRDAPTGNA